MSHLDLPELADARIAVIGLGYVGLPLAVEFGKPFDTLGFDINAARVAALRRGHDHTGETTPAELAAATRLTVTTDAAALRSRHGYSCVESVQSAYRHIFSIDLTGNASA